MTALWSKLQAEELTLNSSLFSQPPAWNAESPGKRRRK
jgi:hypothetical protein